MNFGEFIKSAGGIASALSACIALATLILIKPIRARIAKKREARAQEVKARVDFQTSMLEGMADIRTAIKELGDDVAELQRDRLCEAHEHYMRTGWCPPAKKRELCEWHRQYSAHGRNHLAEHYEDDLLSLPDFPNN